MYMPYTDLANTSFFAFTVPKFQLIVDKDVAVVQRCYTQGQFDFIRSCRHAGMRIIMDLDDDVWHIPPHNPAFDVLSKCKQGFVECMKIVDAVTVSTKRLARVVASSMKKHPVPIIVVENRINKKLFAAPKKHPQLTVGWGGSLSHQGFKGQKGTGDLGIIEGVITKLAAECPDTRFEFAGAMPDQSVFATPNVFQRAGVPIAEYGARMPVWGWHISLAPLTADEFNESKSSIKMVEAGYCGIPCLATHSEPYQRFVGFDSELRWLLCRTEEQWIEKLRTLIHEPAMREELGRRMRTVTDKHFSFDKRHEGWDKAFAAAQGCR